ncbi:MAG: hypothetical protein ABSG03_19065 [Bryobacteraceae bacterium]|jgi:hypothetical protein
MNHQTISPGEPTPAPPIVQPSVNGLVDNATLQLLASWRVQDTTKNPG